MAFVALPRPSLGPLCLTSGRLDSGRAFVNAVDNPEAELTLVEFSKLKTPGRPPQGTYNAVNPKHGVRLRELNFVVAARLPKRRYIRALRPALGHNSLVRARKFRVVILVGTLIITAANHIQY